MDLPSQKHSFPIEVHKKCADDKSVSFADERTGEELLVNLGSKTSRDIFNDWLVLTPFDSELLIDLSDATAIPVKIVKMQEKVRVSIVQKFLTGSKPQQGNFQVMKNIQANGIKSFEMSPQKAADGILLINHSLSVAPEKIEHYCANTIKKGIVGILQLQNSTPVFSERRYSTSYGKEIREKVEVNDRRHEYPELKDKILNPQIRSMLESAGKIVYESDPNGCDRLLICFKHIHGRISDIIRTDEFCSTNDIENPFRKHQQSLIDIFTKLYAVITPKKLKMYCESYPQSFEALSDIDKDMFLNSARAVDVIRKPEEYPQYSYLVDMLSLELNADREDIIKIFTSTFSVNDEVMNLRIKDESKKEFFGDGRFERFHKDEINLSNIQSDIKKSFSSFGEMGFASSVTALKQKMDNQTFTVAQREIVKNIAKTLCASEVGLMQYGGAHFNSGNSDENSLVAKFEDYLKFLPRTQFVVVEEKNYLEADILLETMFKNFTKLPIHMREAIDSVLDNMSELTLQIKILLGKWVNCSSEEEKIITFGYVKGLVALQLKALSLVKDVTPMFK